MIKRSLVALALVGLTLLASGGADAQRRRRTVVKIGKPSLSTRRVRGTGGTVSMRIRISPARRGVVIRSVTSRARIRGTNTVSSSVRLTFRGNGLYVGNVQIPANPRRSSGFADISVNVVTNAGSQAKKVGSVRLDSGGFDPNQPPPPPPI